MEWNLQTPRCVCEREKARASECVCVCVCVAACAASHLNYTADPCCHWIRLWLISGHKERIEGWWGCLALSPPIDLLIKR